MGKQRLNAPDVDCRAHPKRRPIPAACSNPAFTWLGSLGGSPSHRGYHCFDRHSICEAISLSLHVSADGHPAVESFGNCTIAVLTKKRATAIRALVTNVIMHAFFLYVLLDQIPARTVVMKGLVERPDQWILLVPIGMYIATMIGTVVHGLLAGYLASALLLKLI